MIEDQANIAENNELQEKENVKVKAKRLLEKHKQKIYIVTGVVALVGTNAINHKITRSKSLSIGVNTGMKMVMNNPSMLGKGLNSFKKK